MSTGLMRLVAAVLAITATLIAGGAAAADKPRGTAVDPAYQQAFEKWKGELVEDLKENWLPLAGLFWLRPGTNTFGTDPANDIVLPNGSAPARVGSFEFQGGDVTVNFLPDVRATIGQLPTPVPQLSCASPSHRGILRLCSGPGPNLGINVLAVDCEQQ